MVAVRKKQIMINRAIMTTKIKLERVSKPSEWASCSRGSGKMAMRMKTKGRRSQAIEFLMDIELRRRLKKMRARRTSAATKTSI